LQFEKPILVVECFPHECREHRLCDSWNWRAARFFHFKAFQLSFDRSHPLFTAAVYSDLIDQIAGDDGFGAGLCDVGLRGGMIVTDLEEDPLARTATAADENPFTPEFLAVKCEVQ